METQRIIEFPHKNLDKRPRKRPRLTWDIPPPLPPPNSKVKEFVFPFFLFSRICYKFSDFFFLYVKNFPQNTSEILRSLFDVVI